MVESPDRTRRLWTLWLIVSALWSIATLLRADRVWAPQIGWQRILESPWLWCSLALPPAMFGVILNAVHRRLIGR